ncbi:DUF1566 domain-containing protein, partial [bacterium]|nr:DUF1566 domain-containing protein [bacterium]
ENTSRREKRIVIDRATRLIWQRSGSKYQMSYKKTAGYIAKLNQKNFAGYRNWRLPTLEEAMSLMEPQRCGKLYIDLLFDKRQWWIWTADCKSADEAWVVNFEFGSCYYYNISGGHLHSVRAVCWGSID